MFKTHNVIGLLPLFRDLPGCVVPCPDRQRVCGDVFMLEICRLVLAAELGETEWLVAFFQLRSVFGNILCESLHSGLEIKKKKINTCRKLVYSKFQSTMMVACKVT